MHQKDLYLSLGEKPKLMDENEWDLLDCQAFVAIRLTLSKTVAFKIKKQVHNMSLVATLTSMYEQPSCGPRISAHAFPLDDELTFLFKKMIYFFRK